MILEEVIQSIQRKFRALVCHVCQFIGLLVHMLGKFIFHLQISIRCIIVALQDISLELFDIFRK